MPSQNSNTLSHDSINLLNAAFPSLNDVYVCTSENWAARPADSMPPLPDTAGSYFCPSTLTALPRLLANAARVYVMVIDDIGTKIDRTEYDLFALPPSYLVETSQSNFQYGYIIAGGMEPDEYARLREVMKRHPVWGVADGRDAVHWWRLPQGVNPKARIKGKPRWQTVGVMPNPVKKYTGAELWAGFVGRNVGIAGTSGAPGGASPMVKDDIYVRKLLGILPNEAGTSYDEYVTVAHAIKGMGGSIEDFEEWAAKWPGGNDPVENARVWNSLGEPRAGAQTLLGMLPASDLDRFQQADAARVFDDGVVAPIVPGRQMTPDHLLMAEHLAYNNMEKTARFNVDSGCWHAVDGRGLWEPHAGAVKLGYRAAMHWALAHHTQVAMNSPALARAMLKSAFPEGVETALRQLLPIKQANFDTDGMKLGTPGGTVDLTTGKLMRVNPRDYISKSTRAIPAETEDCPMFKKFLSETVPLDASGAPDKATLVFLQQWFGYCLTGLTKEQVFLFIYGPGGNGKSVLMDTIGWVLGDYFVRPTDGLYLQSGGGRHLQEVAMLAGARMAAVPDVPANARWNEARLKDHTGGGLVTANFMRQNSFSFEPQFKLVVSGNHKPTFPGGMTAAVKRRFKLLNFDRRPKVVDKGLVQKLKGEGPGILRWMLAGLCDPAWGYLKVGLMVPGMVDRATDAYFDSQDDFGAWLGGDIEVKRGGFLGATEALGAWRGWAAANGVAPDLYSNPSTFAEEMSSRGFTTVKNGLGKKEYRDIILKSHTKSVFD